MTVKGLRDYALIYVNGEKVGELDRMTKQYELNVNIPSNGQLDILVENMGRINYGDEIPDNMKGIISPVVINDTEVTGNWEMYKLPMDKMPDTGKVYTAKNGLPAIYSASFSLNKVGDTFLDMRKWGKGIVFINGYNLGRYWKIGPQQTLYLPGCWLRKGMNKIVIFEQQNDNVPTVINTVKQPILDQLSNNQ